MLEQLQSDLFNSFEKTDIHVETILNLHVHCMHTPMNTAELKNTLKRVHVHILVALASGKRSVLRVLQKGCVTYRMETSLHSTRSRVHSKD